MKKRFFLWALILLFLFPCGVAAEEDTYIVTAKDNASISAAFEKKYDLTQLTEKDHGFYVTDKTNAEKLKDDPKIKSVTETEEYYLFATVNDPYYLNGDQWGIDAINGSYGWDIVPLRPVQVIVIDTGYNFQHEDKGNVTGGKNYITGGKTTNDPNGHGTACCSVIAAKTNNGIGIAGLASQCNVTILNIFEKNSEGKTTANNANIIAAIYDAVDVHHADVISMSFGTPTINSEVKKAVDYAEAHGAILVAATGNEGDKGSPLEYPAAYENVIGVANMDQSMEIYYNSTSNESVYIAAPGTAICVPGTETNNYGHMSGTSLATPHIAAVAALARAVDPSLTVEQFKFYLRSTSKDIEGAGYDIFSGYGLIDEKALLSAVAADKGATLSGSGTAADPYKIANGNDLRLFCRIVEGGQTNAVATVTANFTVPTNVGYIDSAFSGVFDGGGHTISGLQRDLFASVAKAGVIKNLIVRGNIENDYGYALIANENRGKISHCRAEGSVKGEFSAGLCGINYGTVEYSVNSAAINGEYAGGICIAESGGTVAQCYNRASVTSTAKNAAGICSEVSNKGAVKNCYNTGAVKNTTATGGIIAHTDKTAVIRNCFYEKNSVSGGSSSATVAGKTAEYMKTEGFVGMLNNGYAYYDLDRANTNNGYPVFGAGKVPVHFKDVENQWWFADAVYGLAVDGILAGRGDGKFDPYANVTRAEFAIIMAKSAGANLPDYQKHSVFKDVPDNCWYNSAVNWAYEQKLTYGKTTTTFAPGDPITREEVATFLGRYIHTFYSGSLPTPKPLAFRDNKAISSWAKNDVALLTTLSVINGFPDRTFGPKANASRAEAAQMMYKMREKLF